jgi:hypothetical protein
MVSGERMSRLEFLVLVKMFLFIYFSVSCPNVDSVANGHDETKSGMLKNFICDYFIQSSVNVPTDWKPEVRYLHF